MIATVYHSIANLNTQSGGTSRLVVDMADAFKKYSAIQPIVLTQIKTNDFDLASDLWCVSKMT
jgi:hypothetical protein